MLARIQKKSEKSGNNGKTGTLPFNPRHDDLYLVSYPKSGTTWLNFIIANVNILMSNMDEEVNVFNIHDFVPDIHYSQDIGNIRATFPNYRIIKSHDNYNIGYKKVIYLIRDPRDTMVSFFHFSCSLNLFSGSLSEFIRSPIYGIESWCTHLKSWYEDSPIALRIYFMRYEDMKNNTFDTLNAMYTMLGHHIPENVLQRAIELSSFSKMKESENKWAYGGRPSGKQMTFMRKGKSGAYSNELSKEDIDYINTIAGKLMSQFNYAFDRT